MYQILVFVLISAVESVRIVDTGLSQGIVDTTPETLVFEDGTCMAHKAFTKTMPESNKQFLDLLETNCNTIDAHLANSDDLLLHYRHYYTYTIANQTKTADFDYNSHNVANSFVDFFFDIDGETPSIIPRTSCSYKELRNEAICNIPVQDFTKNVRDARGVNPSSFYTSFYLWDAFNSNKHSSGKCLDAPCVARVTLTVDTDSRMRRLTTTSTGHYAYSFFRTHHDDDSSYATTYAIIFTVCGLALLAIIGLLLYQKVLIKGRMKPIKSHAMSKMDIKQSKLLGTGAA